MMKRFLSILLVLMLLLPAAALADGGDTFAMISHPSAKYITLREGPSDHSNHLRDATRNALEKYIINKKWTY